MYNSQGLLRWLLHELNYNMYVLGIDVISLEILVYVGYLLAG